MDNRAIGMFDSGMGGLSVLKTAMVMLPQENFIYYGDDGNAPYGTKPLETIKELAENCVRFLLRKNVKAIVIACNTATSAAINDIRGEMKLPVVSMEPAIKPAIERGNGGRILMLATPATCAQERYRRLQKRVDGAHQVVNVPCYGLVEAIEEGDWRPERFDGIFQKLLAPYEGQHIEGIVLGCTHYPFIKAQIERYAAAHFTGPTAFYDGHRGTVCQLGRVLEAEGLRSGGPGGKAELYTSGDSERLLPLFHRLLESYQPD